VGKEVSKIAAKLPKRNKSAADERRQKTKSIQPQINEIDADEINSRTTKDTKDTKEKQEQELNRQDAKTTKT